MVTPSIPESVPGIAEQPGGGLSDELPPDPPGAADALAPFAEETPPGTATPPPPPVAEQLSKLQQENLRLQEQQSLWQSQQEYQQMVGAAGQAAQQYAQQLMNQGWGTEDQCRAYAQQWASGQIAVFQLRETQKGTLIDQLSREHGVPKAALVSFQDGVSMRRYAEEWGKTQGPNSKRLKDLEAEVARLKRGQVPAQAYDQPGAAAGRSGATAIWNAYGRGEISWSPRVQQAGKALGHL